MLSNFNAEPLQVSARKQSRAAPLNQTFNPAMKAVELTRNFVSPSVSTLSSQGGRPSPSRCRCLPAGAQAASYSSLRGSGRVSARNNSRCWPPRLTNSPSDTQLPDSSRREVRRELRPRPNNSSQRTLQKHVRRLTRSTV